MTLPRVAVLLTTSLLCLAALLGVAAALIYPDLPLPSLTFHSKRAAVVVDAAKLRELRRQAALEAVQTEVAQLKKDLAELRVKYFDARRSLDEKEIVLADLERRGLNITGRLPPVMPAIDGKVEVVRPNTQPPLVLLSLGADDKVEKGFQFSIYRGTEYIGKVVVEKVLKDICGCRVLYTREGHEVRAGDTATTRPQ